MINKYGATGDPTPIVDCLIGRTFSEAIADMGEKVKVGAEDGNAFFFCGETKTLAENLPFVNKRIKRSTEKAFKRAMARAKSEITNPDASLSGYLKKCARSADAIENMNPTMEGYMEYLEGCMNSAVKAAKAVVPHREKDENCSPLNDRIIKNAYKSITDDATTIVLVEGGENGWFWSEDEQNEAWGIRRGKLTVIRGASTEGEDENGRTEEDSEAD